MSEEEGPIAQARVDFAVIRHPNLNDEVYTIALSKFDGVMKVGIGANEREAIHDLFHNAFPGKTTVESPQFGWLQLPDEKDLT